MKNMRNNSILKDKEKAYLEFKKSNYSKTINLLNNIIKQDITKDSACYFLLGTSYFHSNNLDLAEKNLKISFELNPNFYDTIYNLGIIARLKENISEAINYFTKALNLNLKSIKTLIQLGECYEINKSFEDAKNFYSRAIEIDENNKFANKGLSRILIKFGYHKLSMKYLQKSSGLIRFKENNYEII
tara:strand:+ start:457 stop:1017 length:561 start_codon:yes stop_codon:yes gene_type:complete